MPGPVFLGSRDLHCTTGILNTATMPHSLPPTQTSHLLLQSRSSSSTSVLSLSKTSANLQHAPHSLLRMRSTSAIWKTSLLQCSAGDLQVGLASEFLDAAAAPDRCGWSLGRARSFSLFGPRKFEGVSVTLPGNAWYFPYTSAGFRRISRPLTLPQPGNANHQALEVTRPRDVRVTSLTIFDHPSGHHNDDNHSSATTSPEPTRLATLRQSTAPLALEKIVGAASRHRKRRQTQFTSRVPAVMRRVYGRCQCSIRRSSPGWRSLLRIMCWQ